MSACWEALKPAVARLRDYYEFTEQIQGAFPELMRALCEDGKLAAMQVRDLSSLLFFIISFIFHLSSLTFLLSGPLQAAGRTLGLCHSVRPRETQHALHPKRLFLLSALAAAHARKRTAGRGRPVRRFGAQALHVLRVAHSGHVGAGGVGDGEKKPSLLSFVLLTARRKRWARTG